MAVKVSVAPKGMGLNDFVAMQEGFFRYEGLDVEFDMKTCRGTQGTWKDLQYFDRPQDRPYSEGRSVIQGACAWGSVCSAGAGLGKFVRDSRRSSTAKWKQRACCHRKSIWPSNWACARSSRIRSTRSGGCRTTWR